MKVSALVGIAFLVIAAVLAAIGVTDNSAAAFFNAYLHGYTFFLGLALGGLFFTMLHHLTRAGWSTVVRRLSEAIACTIPLFAILSLPILISTAMGKSFIFPWADPHWADHGAIEQMKALYLNPPFFILRSIIYFAVWTFLAFRLFGWSVQQDKSGDPELTARMHNLSAPGMLLFAITTTFFAFDYLMSLDPLWFSTIFGVYFFAGCFLSFLSFMVVLVQWLQASGRLVYAVTSEHFQDLGKLIFAFIVFWAYIAFSQYMLIWYGDIPEETHWYLLRQNETWQNLSWFIIIGHFIIPFFGLISRYPKRRKGFLLLGALYVLFIHWVDLYWLIAPEWSNRLNPAGGLPINVFDLLCFLGMGGMFLAGMAYFLRGQALVPERDPRLAESLSFENA